MEEQLTRIADSFERIAVSLEMIHKHGLELYTNSGSFDVHIDVDDVPLSGMVVADLSSGVVDVRVEVKNEKTVHGCIPIPFVIEQS
jgi:hypothetical protein